MIKIRAKEKAKNLPTKRYYMDWLSKLIQCTKNTLLKDMMDKYNFYQLLSFRKMMNDRQFVFLLKNKANSSDQKVIKLSLLLSQTNLNLKGYVNTVINYHLGLLWKKIDGYIICDNFVRVVDIKCTDEYIKNDKLELGVGKFFSVVIVNEALSITLEDYLDNFYIQPVPMNDFKEFVLKRIEVDLEKKNLLNLFRSFYIQIIYALYCGHKWYKFKHNDLHHDNVLLEYRKRTDGSFYYIPQENLFFNIPGTYGSFKLKIIDFELSEMMNPLQVFDDVNIGAHKQDNKMMEIVKGSMTDLKPIYRSLYADRKKMELYEDIMKFSVSLFSSFFAEFKEMVHDGFNKNFWDFLQTIFPSRHLMTYLKFYTNNLKEKIPKNVFIEIIDEIIQNIPQPLMDSVAESVWYYDEQKRENFIREGNVPKSLIIGGIYLPKLVITKKNKNNLLKIYDENYKFAIHHIRMHYFTLLQIFKCKASFIELLKHPFLQKFGITEMVLDKKEDICMFKDKPKSINSFNNKDVFF